MGSDTYLVGTDRDAHGVRAVKVTVLGLLSRKDARRLAQTVDHLLVVTGANAVRCDLATAEADLFTVDAVARIELVARRHGAHVRILDASNDLIALLEVVGLRDVLGA